MKRRLSLTLMAVILAMFTLAQPASAAIDAYLNIGNTGESSTDLVVFLRTLHVFF